MGKTILKTHEEGKTIKRKRKKKGDKKDFFLFIYFEIENSRTQSEIFLFFFFFLFQCALCFHWEKKRKGNNRAYKSEEGNEEKKMNSLDHLFF